MSSPNEQPPQEQNELASLPQIQASLRGMRIPLALTNIIDERFFRAYDTGLPDFDKDIQRTLVYGARRTQETLAASTEVLYGISSPQKSSAEQTLLLTASGYTEQSSAKYVPQHHDSPDFTQTANKLTTNAQFGIERTPLQTSLHGLEQIMYANYVDAAAHETIGFTMSSERLAALGLETHDGALTTVALHENLAERGAIDLSRKTLDQRFELFTNTAQINILEVMGTALSLISQVGLRQRNIAGLSFQALSILKKDQTDLVSQVNLLDRMAGDWQKYAREDSQTPADKLMALVSVQAYMLAQSVQQRVYFLDQVYDGLGFKPPLRGMGQARTITRAQREAAATAKAKEDESRAAEERARALAKLEGLLPITAGQVEAFNATWSLSSKAYKNGGFQDLRRALIGEHKAYQLSQETALTKPDSRSFIDMLAVLQQHFKTKDANAVRDILQTNHIIEESLVGQVQILDAQFRQLKPGTPKLEEPRTLRAFTSLIQSNWNTYKQLFIDLWPEQGAQFANQLQELFWPPQPEVTTPEAVVETIAEIAVESEIDRLPELDIVVLPARPRDEQVITELQRLGVTPRDLTPQKIARFKDFSSLREVFDDSTLHISRAGAATSRRRYYIMEINHDSRKYTIAESVGLDRATYVFAEHLVPGTGREMLDLYKDEARELGAERIEHADDGNPHHEKILNTLLKLHEQELRG